MFTFSEMLALVESESSFGAYVCHRRPGGSLAISDLVVLDVTWAVNGQDTELEDCKNAVKMYVRIRFFFFLNFVPFWRFIITGLSLYTRSVTCRDNQFSRPTIRVITHSHTRETRAVHR